MRSIRMRIDISGTKGEEAWKQLRHFSEAQMLEFGPQEGSSGPCLHSLAEPHLPGEWWGAVVGVEHHFLAEYVLPHYLEQSRVLDAYIETKDRPTM